MRKIGLIFTNISGEMIKLSASIVVYKHKPLELSKLIQEFCQISAFEVKLFVVDNSPFQSDFSAVDSTGKLEYIFAGSNLGYGKAHNIAIQRSLQDSQYHLVLNPDIEFNAEALVKLIQYLDSHPNVGLIMPKITYPDGETQYLCKQLPGPSDLIFRRFVPGFLKGIMEKRMNQYELKHRDYNQIMQVANLSGCFMLMRCDALKYTGLFDEGFFMYLEDTDLSRRINQQYQTIYYPEVSIVHHYQKGSYKNPKLLWYHINSAIRYFNKWGWFFDPGRKTINQVMP